MGSNLAGDFHPCVPVAAAICRRFRFSFFIRVERADMRKAAGVSVRGEYCEFLPFVAGRAGGVRVVHGVESSGPRPHVNNYFLFIFRAAFHGHGSQNVIASTARNSSANPARIS